MARNIILLILFTGAVFLVLDNFTTSGRKGYVDRFVQNTVPAKLGILGA